MHPVLLPPSDLSPRTDLLTVWTGGLFGSSATVAGDYTTYRGILVMPHIPYDSDVRCQLIACLVFVFISLSRVRSEEL